MKYDTPAEKERAEQIKNAEQAYRNGEITAEQLLWFRTITAKAILERDNTPQRAGGMSEHLTGRWNVVQYFYVS